MEPGRQRRTDRVSLTLLLEVSGFDSQGQEFNSAARTLQINRNGAVILLDRDLKADQRMIMQRRAPGEAGRRSEVRVVGQFGRQDDGYIYSVEILDPAADLWGVEFPSVAESPESVARMLLDCIFCRTREVVYLNELELRTFETNRGIARHCKTCGVPASGCRRRTKMRRNFSDAGRAAGAEATAGERPAQRRAAGTAAPEA